MSYRRTPYWFNKVASYIGMVEVSKIRGKDEAQY